MKTWYLETKMMGPREKNHWKMIVIRKCRNLKGLRKTRCKREKYKHPVLGNARESPVRWWSKYEPKRQQRLK